MLAVIGSNGFLGGHIKRFCIQESIPLLTCSHQVEADVHIDLRSVESGGSAEVWSKVSYAVICSAITNIDDCRRLREETQAINVTQMIRLMKQLMNAHVTPIFCSTDLVFRGSKGNYKETDICEPSTEYGRQKYEVEQFLQSQSRPWVILRLSKLYEASSYDPSPIGTMFHQLAACRPIICADDQMITPTYVGDVVRVIHWIASNHRTGCYHVAGPESMTRFELGKRVAAFVGRPELVQRCSIQDFDFLEQRPINATLNTEKLMSDFPTVFSKVDTHFRNMWSGCMKPSDCLRQNEGSYAA